MLRAISGVRRALTLLTVVSLAGCGEGPVQDLGNTFVFTNSSPVNLVAGGQADVTLSLTCEHDFYSVNLFWVDDADNQLPAPRLETGVVVPTAQPLTCLTVGGSPPAATARLRFYAADDAPLGHRSLTLTVSGDNDDEISVVSVDVVAPSSPGFSLAVPPQVSLTPGSTSVTVPVTVARTSYSGPITLSWQPPQLLNGTYPDSFGGVRTGPDIPAGATTGSILVEDPGLVTARYGGPLRTVLLRARGGGTDRAVMVQLLAATTPPGTPAGFSATPGVRNIALAWDGAGTVLTYRLERETISGVWDVVNAAIPGTLGGFDDTGRTPDTPYAYRLSATNVNGTSAYATLSTRTLPAPLGTGWVQLGAAASVSVVEPQPSLLIDLQGRPVVAYREGVGSDPQHLYVKRFEGGVWTQVGTAAVSNILNDAQQPSLAIDGTGTLYVSWQQNEPVLQNRIYVSRFNGTAWESVVPGGLPVDVAGAPSAQPSLGIATGNVPVVAWRQGNTVQVRRLSGGVWVPSVGTGAISAAGVYDLHMTADGAAIAWAEGAGPTSAVKVVSGTDFSALGTSATPSPLGANVSAFGVVDFLGVPYVTYAEGTSPFSIRTRRWDGSGWVDYGVPITNTNENTLVSLAMDSKELVVAYSFSCVGAGCSALGVYSATSTGWGALTPFLALTAPLVSRGLSVAMATNTSPVVAAGVQVGTTYELRVRQYIP